MSKAKSKPAKRTTKSKPKPTNKSSLPSKTGKLKEKYAGAVHQTKSKSEPVCKVAKSARDKGIHIPGNDYTKLEQIAKARIEHQLQEWKKRQSDEKQKMLANFGGRRKTIEQNLFSDLALNDDS